MGDIAHCHTYDFAQEATLTASIGYRRSQLAHRANAMQIKQITDKC